MNLENKSAKLLNYPENDNSKKVWDKLRSVGFGFSICCFLPRSSRFMMTFHLASSNIGDKRVHSIPYTPYVRDGCFDVSKIFECKKLDYPKRFIWNRLTTK